MLYLVILAVWFLLSVPLGIAAGKFIAHGAKGR